MRPQALTLVIITSAIVASTQIPFKDPNVLNSARILYAGINVLVFGAHVYTRVQILKKRDMTPVETESSTSAKTTVYNYDVQQWYTLLRGHLTSIMMVAIMHLYLGLPTPLIIQSILPAKDLFESKLVKIHLFGEPTIGEMQRPWKAEPGLLDKFKTRSEKKDMEEAGGAEQRSQKLD